MLFSILMPERDREEGIFESLRKRCARGEPTAQREFIRRYEPVVWTAVQARLPQFSRQDQEEVVANTFVILLRNGAELLQRYERGRGRTPKSFIHHLAVLQSISRFRSLNRDKRLREVYGDEGENEENSPEGGMLDVDPERRLIDEQHLYIIRKELKKTLSPLLCLTFELLYTQDLSIEEVAKAMKCSTSTIYARRKRILKECRTILAEVEAGARTVSGLHALGKKNHPEKAK